MQFRRQAVVDNHRELEVEAAALHEDRAIRSKAAKWEMLNFGANSGSTRIGAAPVSPARDDLCSRRAILVWMRRLVGRLLDSDWFDHCGRPGVHLAGRASDV
jgi:hypothetical protein